jgi:hypothetical protein
MKNKGEAVSVMKMFPILIFLALAASVTTAAAQQPESSEKNLSGTATLVLMGQTPTAALTELALLQSGDKADCWTLVNTDLARPIPKQDLRRFTDAQAAPFPTLKSNLFEYDALNNVLLLAAKNTPAAFRTSASAQRRVTYAMLFGQPGRHCGEVVHIVGDLQLVRKLETPPTLKRDGVDNVYEAWIVDQAVSSTPYCVLLTELPPELSIGKSIHFPVALDAYFLKRREEAEGDVPLKAWHSSLLLAGRSLTVEKIPGPMTTTQGRATIGAATLMLSGDPLQTVALLRNGERAGCWTLVDTDVVRPIPPEVLANIKDGPTLPTSANQGLEFDALCDVLVQTWYTSPAAFRKAAWKDIGFGQLFYEPERYRGQVVHIEGRLRLVQRWDPPLMAQEAGVPPMYEAAIFDDVSGKNPYIVLVMERPEDIPLNQKVEATVTFDGYFYKKWQYKAVDSLKPTSWREAPLLIGRSLKVRVVLVAPTQEEENGGVVPVVVAGLAVLTVVVGAMFMLAFWLRRGDARVQDKLHAVRTRQFVLPGVDELPRED